MVENLPTAEPVSESISIEQGWEFETEHTSLRLELASPVWDSSLFPRPSKYL